MITYKNKEYITRKFRVLFQGEEREYTIASESLSKAIGINDGESPVTSLETSIDEQIYFYVPDAVILLDGDLICAEYLDEPMEFLEEIK